MSTRLEGATTPTRSNSSSSQGLQNGCKEKVPVEDMFFDTLEEGEWFYHEYANMVGFDVRTRSTLKGEEAGIPIITWKCFVCNKEGQKEESKKPVRYQKKEVRNGCQAEIRFKRMKDGKYVVFRFVGDHSHDLYLPSKKLFLKGSRQVNSTAKRALVTCSKVNIGVGQTFNLLKEQFGGYDNVGCTQKDLCNFQRELRTLVADSDGQILVDRLRSKKELDPSFFCDVDFYDDQRLKHVFWADGVCRKNYALFGDVMSFDSTYNTNKYSLIFSPFTGINHHKSCVCFGVALLASEEVESYKWVFKAFLKAMEAKEPNVIITDEDQSMRVAIESTFTRTKHRLCMWHILKKLPQKLSSELLCNRDFVSRLHSCIRDSETSEEFESTWEEMLSEYDLQEHVWLASKFNIREDWIPAYFEDVFLARLVRTTSRSESENSFFGRFVNHKISLAEFWMKIESALEKQRHRENELDNKSINKLMPTSFGTAIEKQARDAFTAEVFRIFQDELKKSGFFSITKGMKEEGVLHVHNVLSDGKIREVAYNASTGVVTCSCKKFESIGIPCQHILMVLRLEEVNELPSNLILDRWTKKINRKEVFDNEGNVLGGTFRGLSNELRKKASSIYDNFDILMNNVCHDGKKLEAVAKIIIDANNQLGGSNSSKGKSNDLIDYIGSSISEEIEVRPPNHVRTKGAPKKRSKEMLEKALSKKPRKCEACGKVGHNRNKCPTLDLDGYDCAATDQRMLEEERPTMSMVIRAENVESFEEIYIGDSDNQW